MEIRYVKRKDVVWVSLFGCVLLFSFILLSKPYWYSHTPIGWDTPFYIGLTKLFLKNGVDGLISETYYFHFYNIFSSLFVSFGIVDPFLAEIVLPFSLAMFVIILSAYVAWIWFHDIELSLYTMFFTSTSLTVTRLMTDLHRNLLAFVFLLLVLSLIPRYVKGKSVLPRICMLILLFLMVITQIETYVLSLLIFCAFTVLLLAQHSNFTFKDAVKGIFFYIFPLLLMLVLLFPVIGELWKNIQPWPLVGEVSLPRILDHLFAVNFFSFVVLCFMWIKEKEFRQTCLEFFQTKEHSIPVALLASWGLCTLLSALLPLIGVSIPPFRALLMFPSPFILAIGLMCMIRVMRRMKGKVVQGTHRLNKPVFIAVTLFLIIMNVHFSYIYVDSYMRRFMSDSTYERLRMLESHSFSTKPIVVCFFRAGKYTEGLLIEYRLWLKAAIDDHQVFFGKLHFLIANTTMRFQDPDVDDASIHTWEELTRNIFNIHDQPVLIIPGDFYPSLSSYERALMDEIFPGVYVLKNDYQNVQGFPSMRLNAYPDFYSISENCYFANYNWASEKWIIECHESFPESISYIVFNFPIISKGLYAINVRMIDADVMLAPVTVYLDSIASSTIHYNGTEQVRTCRVFYDYLDEGLHSLAFRIEDLGREHFMALDWVDIVLKD